VNRQDPPWKVVRAFPRPGAGALVHLNNVSGGVLAGDRLTLDVEVLPGASAQITTTGATRLYRHRKDAADSEQHSRFYIREGAVLEYLPDAVIPYAGSRHVQRTEIHLQPGAALFWWEVLAPGRQAAGERFAFDRLRVETDVRTGARPILRESFLLEPRQKSLSSVVRMFDYSYVASFYACQEGRPPAFWRSLERRLNEVALKRTRPREAVWGASMLAADGVMVRGLSTASRFLHGALVEFWRLARLAVTGEEAVPPRKVY
jgi:urease accessory protein